MPTPHEFKSEAELIEMLRHGKTLATAEAFFAVHSPDVRDVVITGVTGNTFRAFRNLPVRLSITFRDWAISYVQKTISVLSDVATESAYSSYVHKATLSLCEEWHRLTGSEMGYGRGAKLFNLVLKKFACLCTLSADQKRTLIALQHVPLD